MEGGGWGLWGESEFRDWPVRKMESLCGTMIFKELVCFYLKEGTFPKMLGLVKCVAI